MALPCALQRWRRKRRITGSFFSQNTLNPDSKIQILKQCPDIKIREYAILPDLTNPDYRKNPDIIGFNKSGL